MDIIVKKFGGTSVQDDEARLHALRHVKDAVSKGFKVAVVVSAIGRQGAPYATDSLLSLVGGKDTLLDERELDMLVSTGEILSTGVFTELLKQHDIKAIGMTGPDAGIKTNNEYQNAKVLDVDTRSILDAFADNDVVVVAGFQGLSQEGRITTLGRGGSDTSAALLAAALRAKYCDIFTDVSGMMTGDPRVIKHARFLNEISYDEVANMAHEGAKVIHPRAVEVAQQAHIPMRIRSTWDDVDKLGTVISQNGIKHPVIGVTHQLGLTQFRVPTEHSDKVLSLLADHDISVDFININSEAVVFNLTGKASERAKSLFTAHEVDFSFTDDCAKVSIVGSGMMDTPGVVATLVTALSQKDIDILQTSDGFSTIWALVTGSQFAKAVNALHDAFILNQTM
ncbi:aspartate kinase [Ligilactobacillus equi]|uniref:Aspartokinase n=1 Tax=Ligilactobacillus equi DSM 15833 = JCM 10991 TaxID=1423740 RepID=A0A0R1U150_9LACO|nr:aspartate kinase [Ligilactobacillus equi]KRL83275.1 aspartate kinase I [Ligilactobacillus equi DSM 15833 = JCM 10991]